MLLVPGILLSYFSGKGTSQEIPRRIISLGPALTEGIYLLGAENNLVGCTIFCRKPQDAARKEKVGSVVEINVERVISLKPDLVLATSLTDRRSKEKLQKLGIRVVTFMEAKDFSELCRQFSSLGKILGKEKEADKIIDRAKKDVAAIFSRIKGHDKPKVLLELGANPLFVATDRTFVNDFIVLSGGVNIASGARSGLYSREEVIRRNPDVIIIVDMGITAEKEREFWLKFKDLSAAKKNQVYILNPDKVCSPTPLSFAETLKEISVLLHPSPPPHEK